MFDLNLLVRDVVQVMLEAVKVHLDAKIELLLVCNNQLAALGLLEATLVLLSFGISERVWVQPYESSRTESIVLHDAHHALVLTGAIFRGVMRFLVNFATHDVRQGIDEGVGALFGAPPRDRLVEGKLEMRVPLLQHTFHRLTHNGFLHFVVARDNFIRKKMHETVKTVFAVYGFLHNRVAES